jgi:hypothetical protein
MNSGGNSEDKVVVDPAGPEATGPSRALAPALRDDDRKGVRARGTREQPVSCPPEAPVARRRDLRELGRAAAAPVAGSRGIRELDRDPVEVLRMWPHSTGLEGHVAATRARLPGPSAQRRFEDKIGLAHLALDLYRELDDIQATGRDAGSVQRAVPATCDDRRCDARTHALRGALVEACLLVQRAVMMTPSPMAVVEIEDRLRELLELIDH